MRAVERTPWAERRSARHDEMCLAIAADPRAIIGCHGRATVEAPCGTGFCDVLVESSDRSSAWFVEVKTAAESASAGDVIRQLRWYAAQRTGYERKVLVCVTEGDPGTTFRGLLKAAGVRHVVLGVTTERRSA